MLEGCNTQSGSASDMRDSTIPTAHIARTTVVERLFSTLAVALTSSAAVLIVSDRKLVTFEFSFV
jgi:hypothetical protein